MQRDMLCKVITANSTNSSSYSIYILYIYYYYYYYYVQEGQSAPQTPQTLFDADFEGLASNAEVYIFNQDDSQE